MVIWQYKINYCEKENRLIKLEKYLSKYISNEAETFNVTVIFFLNLSFLLKYVLIYYIFNLCNKLCQYLFLTINIFTNFDRSNDEFDTKNCLPT